MQLIEPYEHRMHAVEQFLKCWARENSKALEISIIPITESAPPAATVDSTLECLVVSEDTEKGAQVFNDARVAAGLPPLTVGTYSPAPSPWFVSVLRFPDGFSSYICLS